MKKTTRSIIKPIPSSTASSKLHKKGFTLIELLVVVSIITLLSGVVKASVTEARSKSNNTKQLADYRSIIAALIQFKQDHGYYPASSTEACFGSYTSGGCLVANESMTPDSKINSDMNTYLSSYSFVDSPSVVVSTSFPYITTPYRGFIFSCTDSSTQYGYCKQMYMTFPAMKNSKSCPSILSDAPTNEVNGFTNYTICRIDLK